MGVGGEVRQCQQDIWYILRPQSENKTHPKTNKQKKPHSLHFNNNMKQEECIENKQLLFGCIMRHIQYIHYVTCIHQFCTHLIINDKACDQRKSNQLFK